MNYNLTATLLLLTTGLSMLYILGSGKIHAYVKKTAAPCFLLVLVILVGLAYSKWNIHHQIRQQVSKSREASSLLDQGQVFRWAEVRDGETARYQVFYIGQTRFVATVHETRYPFIWTPTYRVESVLQDTGFERNFDAALQNILYSNPLFSGTQSSYEPEYMRAGITLSGKQELPREELGKVLQRFVEGMGNAEGQQDTSKAYRIDMEYRLSADEKLVAKAYKETGDLTFRWIKPEDSSQ